MNPYLMRSLFSASAPPQKCSSSYYKSHPVILQSLFPYDNCSFNTLNFEYKRHIQKNRRVVCSQKSSESYGGNLSTTGALEKPRNQSLEGNTKTTSYIMPSEIKPSEIKECEVFKKVKEAHGKRYMEFMMRKLVPVAGTVCEADLGMDAHTANDIAKQVHVVINSAATTSFDERYDVALNTNTKGPFRLLNFEKKCKNLCLFFHISTAYVGDGERQGIIMDKPLYVGQGRVRAITEQDIDAELKLASEMVNSVKQNQATQKMKEFGIKMYVVGDYGTFFVG